MEKAHFQNCKNMHRIHKTLPTYEHDYTEEFGTQFRPLPEVIAYDTYFLDPKNGLDLNSEKDLYDQDKLELKDTHNNSNDQIEGDDLISDAHLSHAFRYAIINLRTVNPHLLDI